jgi:Ni,Fe-hydrogenase III small subunit/formate hydrogenlyase subunit 6/NADH:ubiquinone oxidoreductase subunit I
MLDIFKVRLKAGRETVAFPDGPPRFPNRFRGRPVLDPTQCSAGCSACAEACPTEAIDQPGLPTMRLDLGRCLFCAACIDVCPTGGVAFTRDHRLAMRKREELWAAGDVPKLAEALDARFRKLFGRSLRLRQISAAGCNGCEAELNASGNIQFDLSRFGIQFVASPRHADGIVVTGPISENMKLALQKTWEAVPEPRLVVAVGACAISGGPFRGSPVVANGCGELVPVDLWIPGCPPHPITLIDGFLRLLGRLEGDDAHRLAGPVAPEAARPAPATSGPSSGR